MSTSTEKRPRAQALADAEAFRAMFTPDTYERWEFAGSLRRGRAHVGDVEHVVIPRIGEIDDGTSLFSETKKVNLLLHRLDELVRTYVIEKHIYGTEKPAPRWGERLRGADFRGFNHEVFIATADNWGSTYAIRTGPSGYSTMLVQLLFKRGYWNYEGHVWKRENLRCACGWMGAWVTADFRKPLPGEPRPLFIRQGEALICPWCKKGDAITMPRVSVPDEQTYFRLCGLNWVEPSKRYDPEERR